VIGLVRDDNEWRLVMDVIAGRRIERNRKNSKSLGVEIVTKVSRNISDFFEYFSEFFDIKHSLNLNLDYVFLTLSLL
jgi:hypothetical protein